MCLQIIKIRANASMHVEQIWETLVISGGENQTKQVVKPAFVTSSHYLNLYIYTSLVI